MSPRATDKVRCETRLAEMAGVIAHEVRNPLAGVRAAIELVRTRLSAHMAETLVMDEVLARVDSLDAVIDSLLLFAQTPRPRFASVDLRPLIDEVAHSLGSRYTSEFQIIVEGSLPTVWGDAALLRVAFQNLLLNASQAMQGGGIVIRLVSDGPYVRVSIADQGLGFSVDALAELFRPFFSTKARGTGLGLPMAKRLVALHHGSLELENSRAAGARVIVRLPNAAGQWAQEGPV